MARPTQLHFHRYSNFILENRPTSHWVILRTIWVTVLLLSFSSNLSFQVLPKILNTHLFFSSSIIPLPLPNSWLYCSLPEISTTRSQLSLFSSPVICRWVYGLTSGFAGYTGFWTLCVLIMTFISHLCMLLLLIKGLGYTLGDIINP